MTDAPKTFKNFNPATGALINEQPFASVEAIESALHQLHSGFQSWNKLTVEDRQKQLMEVLENLRNSKSEFTTQMTLTMGKPIAQSEAEFMKSVAAVEYLCQQNWTVLKARTLSDPAKRHEIRREPIGVIVGVMPWNFPLWQAVRMIFPTLIAGNSILLKHAEITSPIGDLLAKIFNELNTKHNIFQHLMFSHTLTEKIVADPRVGGISITGSIGAGRSIGEIAGRHLKKAVLELGGSDPSLIFSDCNLETTAKSVLSSRFSNAGQVCIATKRIFVERSILQKFIDAILPQFKSYKPDDPMNGSTKMGPLAHVKFKNEFIQQMQAVAIHSEVIAENRLDIAPLNSAYVNPKILLFNKHIEFFKTNEVFGPALCLIPFDSESDALQLANSTIFGLGASIYTTNPARIENLTCDLGAGQVSVNTAVASDIKLPFGGQKQSGLGREMGEDGFLEFSQTKVVSYELESP